MELIKKTEEFLKETFYNSPYLREMKLATEEASRLWKLRIDYYISFYEKLQTQLESSTAIR